MKLYRNIIIIVLTIALLGGGFYFVYKYDPNTDKEKESESFNLTSISLFKTEKENIKQVVITNSEGTYTVSKSDDKWIINNDTSIKISQTKTDTLIYECAAISVKELIAENVTDFSVYGLTNPKRSAEITLNDGSVTTIIVGDDTIDGSLSYIAIKGDNKVYTKSKSGAESLTQMLSKLRDTSIYSISEEKIGGFTIQRNGSEAITLVREEVPSNKEDKNEEAEPTYLWKMKAPLIKNANDYNLSEKIIKNIVAISANSVESDNPSDLSAYGLNNPYATFSVWDLDKKNQYTVLVGKTVEKNTYVKLSDKNTVYNVEADKINFVDINYLDLVDKLIHLENIDDVNSVKVYGKGYDFTMEIGGTKEAQTYKINNKDIEEKAFKSAYQAVLGITLENHITTNYIGSVDAQITYHKKDGSEVKVEFINYDERNYLVKVNGEGNLTIKKKQVDNMMDKLNQTVNS